MADDRVSGTPERPGEGRREILREWPAWLILAALWVGIRIPPTLENREIWKRTHRLTGRWLVVAGLVGLPLCLLPGAFAHALGLVLILIPLGAGMIYAYVLRHRMETAGTLPPEAP